MADIYGDNYSEIGEKTEYVGVIGVLCGAKSVKYLVPTRGLRQKTRRAKCNRWAGHWGKHRETDPKNFMTLAEWGFADTAVRDDDD
jgi:hypothetical protein